jgi:pimeloyl-ACP methyl ester carboxylesterase
MLRGAFAVTLLLVCSGCADAFLLAPSRQPITVGNDTSRITIPIKDKRVVEIWKTRSAGANSAEPQAFVLRFCGNGERAEDALNTEKRMWSELPVEIWAMNYPGFGGSTGPAHLGELAPAALASYDELTRHAGGRPIFLSGMSMGTTVALYVGANRKTDGILLRSPVPVRDVVLWRYGWWNLWLVAGPVAAGFPSQLDSEQNAHRCAAPAVFIITGNDELVPRSYQRKITGAYAGHKKVVVAENAWHNTPLTDKEVLKVQDELRWLWSRRTIPATRRAATTAK